MTIVWGKEAAKRLAEQLSIQLEEKDDLVREASLRHAEYVTWVRMYSRLHKRGHKKGERYL